MSRRDDRPRRERRPGRRPPRRAERAQDEGARKQRPFPLPREREPAPESAAAAAPPAAERVLWHGLVLNDFQVRAVQAIRAGHNVLVGAPTGAGKTLVAEYAIEDAVRRGRRSIYTAPIKALSNQKFRDFRDGRGLDVGLMTGDVTIRPNAQVLIMTTEILRNAIFESPRELSDVEYVVFDEVHFLDDPERGAVWEESLIFAPPSMRFICLSATVPNIEELGAWIRAIRGHDLVVISSDRRPVPLHHYLYTPRSGAFEARDLEAVRRRELPRDGGARRKDARRRGQRPPPEPATDARGLLDQLQDRGLLPVLVFAFSRKDCERLARANARRDLLSPDEHVRMEALQEELLALFQLERGLLDSEWMQLARRGLGYHHAGMLPIHKELVERMFTSGLLRMLFTTETFALGINMPARSVIFHGLRKFDGVSFEYVRTRDYLQMAGRAGRQGIDDEGLVYSVLAERDLREAPLLRLLEAAPEPVESRFRLSYSTILHLIEGLGRERLGEAWEKSFHQFQHREDSPKARERNRREQRRLLSSHIELLAKLGYLDAQDRLTPRGRIARLITGFELQVTELLFSGVLENLPPRALALVFVALIHEERRRGGGGPFISQRHFGVLRRQVSQILRRLAVEEVERGIAPSKLPDWGLTEAVSAWCDGRSVEELELLTEAGPGDIVRTLRMALQLLRQTRRAIDPEWDLHGLLGEASTLLNRDEVDARRQLELG